MKILALLAFLIALCAAQNDFTYTYLANATQAYSVYSDSTGSCSGTFSYTTDKKATGSFTCTGLTGNITQAHIHGTVKSASVTYNNGDPLTACTITVDKVAASGSILCDFTNAPADELDALTGDRCYLNIHTDYEIYGEVRSNWVGLTALYLFKDYVPKDGVVVVADTTPDTGIKVASFCSTFFATQKAGVTNSNAGGYFTICWDSSKQTLTFSGIFYGVKSTIYGITLSLTGESSYFLSISSYGFQTDTPFAFVVDTVTEWYLAKISSLEAYITIDTSDYPNGELEVYIVTQDGTTGFPQNKAVCRPATLKIDDTRTLKCYSGYYDSQSESTCTGGDFCSIYPIGTYEYKSCSTVNYCYTCDCGADYSVFLPSSGAACCDTDYCNLLTLATKFCLDSGAGSIPVGLLGSLFVALLMKWFN